MNRIAKCLCMVAVIALAFTACKKKVNDTKVLKFNGATEQMVVVDEELDGRMYLDDHYYVQFDNGDEVAVFLLPSDTANDPQFAVFEIGNNGASWEPKTGSDDLDVTGAFYAYYPGGEGYVTPDLGNDNRVKFTLMPTQDYRVVNGKPLIPENALYMAAKADGTTVDEAYFDFKNVCGILAMNLYGSDPERKVTSIDLHDPSFNIVGEVTLKIDEVDPVEMTSLLNRYDIHNPSYVAWLNNYKDRVGYAISGTSQHPVSQTMTLDCETNFPGGVTLGTTAAEATTFYFVLRPLALKNGCNITVHFSDGSKKYLNTTLSHTMRPNHIMKMAALCVDGSDD